MQFAQGWQIVSKGCLILCSHHCVRIFIFFTCLSTHCIIQSHSYFIRLWTQKMFACIYKHTPIYIYVTVIIRICVNICVYMYEHTYMYACIYVYVCACFYAYICICPYIYYGCIHICMYICINMSKIFWKPRSH